MFRKVIHVEPIVVVGRSGVGISRNVFERWDNSTVRNSPAEQERLLRNFRAAMEFQGLAVQTRSFLAQSANGSISIV